MQTYLVLIPIEYSFAPVCVEKLHNETFLNFDKLSDKLNEIFLDNENEDEDDGIKELTLYGNVPIYTLEKFVYSLNSEEININNYFIIIVNIITHEEPATQTSQ